VSPYIREISCIKFCTSNGNSISFIAKIIDSLQKGFKVRGQKKKKARISRIKNYLILIILNVIFLRKNVLNLCLNKSENNDIKRYVLETKSIDMFIKKKNLCPQITCSFNTVLFQSTYE
jgi:hypothetical protein